MNANSSVITWLFLGESGKLPNFPTCPIRHWRLTVTRTSTTPLALTPLARPSFPVLRVTGPTRCHFDCFSSIKPVVVKQPRDLRHENVSYVYRLVVSSAILAFPFSTRNFLREVIFLQPGINQARMWRFSFVYQLLLWYQLFSWNATLSISFVLRRFGCFKWVIFFQCQLLITRQTSLLI